MVFTTFPCPLQRYWVFPAPQPLVRQMTLTSTARRSHLLALEVALPSDKAGDETRLAKVEGFTATAAENVADGIEPPLSHSHINRLIYHI